MSLISRAEFVQRLDGFWAEFPARFQRLNPAERQAFLQRQGYPSLAALLAHVTAWWQDGQALITRMRAEPGLMNPDYDVDAFNAAAVRRFAALDDAAMSALYEDQRREMLRLVDDLSEAEINGDEINRRLFYEIIQHAAEHAF